MQTPTNKPIAFERIPLTDGFGIYAFLIWWDRQGSRFPMIAASYLRAERGCERLTPVKCCIASE
ncbi:protein of unknown function [Hyphomicrobium sp. MC1]|nr:protein of unknown function [Hyphomicrobium sp. MC1]